MNIILARDVIVLQTLYKSSLTVNTGQHVGFKSCLVNPAFLSLIANCMLHVANSMNVIS